MSDPFGGSDAAARGVRIPEAEAIRRFVLAGNAIFTLVGKRDRFTYRVRRATMKNEGAAPLWFVSVLTGSDNTGDYAYLGTLVEGRDNYVVYRHGRKSKVSQTAPSTKAWSWFADKLAGDPRLVQVEVWHAGRCGRCGRLLTVPESIASGIGPECAKKGA